MFKFFRRSKADQPIKGTLPEREQDLTKLPQFWVRARIEKCVPIEDPDAALSWYGGKPKMPEDIPWLMFDGKDGVEPGVFLAQIHCADLPEMLWGGVGPRTGWLLFFAKPKLDVTKDWARVIHIDRLGPERHVSPEVEVQSVWSSYGARQHDGPHFPKWPVKIYEQPEGSPGRYEPYDENAPMPENRPALDHRAWPGGAAGHPITRQGLIEMVDHQEAWLERQIKLWDQRAGQYAEVSQAAEKSDPRPAHLTFGGERFVDLVSARDIALRAVEINRVAHTALASLRGVLVVEPGEEMLPEQEWYEILFRLDAIRFASVQKHRLEPSLQPVTSIHYELAQGTIDICKDWGSQLRAISKHLSKVEQSHKSLTDSIALDNNRIDRLQKPRDNGEQSPERDLTEIEVRKDHSQRAALVLPEVEASRKVMSSLKYEARKRGSKDPVSQADAVALRELVSKTIVVSTERRTVLPAVGALVDLELMVEPASDPTGANALRAEGRRGWADDFEKARERCARAWYCAAMLVLPKTVTEYFERLWVSRALHWHDSMGALPVGYIDYTLFDSRLFQTKAEWRTGEKPLKPFDEDNAVLLELRTDRLTGWIWGDLYSLIIVIARADLAAGRFDRIKAFISN